MINDVNSRIDRVAASESSPATGPIQSTEGPSNLGPHSRAYATWSQNEERRVLEMLILGRSFTEMAEALGRTETAVRKRALRLAVEARYGRRVPDHPPRDRDGQPWTRQDSEMLDALIAAGRSWSEIGHRLARRPSSCRRRAEVAALRYFMEL